jgi:hypothetical protein
MPMTEPEPGGLVTVYDRERDIPVSRVTFLGWAPVVAGDREGIVANGLYNFVVPRGTSAFAAASRDRYSRVQRKT